MVKCREQLRKGPKSLCKLIILLHKYIGDGKKVLRVQSNLCRTGFELSRMWNIKKPNENKSIPIAVSASWNEQYEDLFFEEGPLEYEYKMRVPKQWSNKRVRLYFGAVNTRSEIYIDDQLIKKNFIGYLPFDVEIDKYLLSGEEQKLRVKVENHLLYNGFLAGNMPETPERGKNLPPTNFDFFPYGGIIRPVLIEATSKKAIVDIKFRADKSFPQKKLGVVDIYVEVTEESVGKDIEVLLAGKKIREKIKDTNCEFHIEVGNAHFWNVDDPYLYNLQARILSNGEILDEYNLKVGIRTISLDKKHILINENPVKLLGFGKHEEFPVEGQGTFYPVIVKDFDLMRWIGANSFRTSHYPYSEEWLDMADELGFLVIDEAPHVGLEKYHYENEKTVELCVDNIKKLVDRDKNHPSVIMWSVANEPDSAYPKSEEFFKKLYDTAKAFDPTRPVTMVSCVPFCPKSGGPDVAMKHFDVISINRYYGWYKLQGKIEEAKKVLSDELDELYQQYKRPIIITEFGADAIPGFHSSPPQMFSEEYQSKYIENMIEMLNKKEFVSGMHVWAFADFKTAQNIHRPLFNHKGVFTRTREPKLVVYTLKKLWKGK